MNNQEFIHGLHQLRQNFRPCVATIGSFDGVHRGHQVLLDQLKEKAQSFGLPAMVMLFEPQPNEYFAAGEKPPRLMRLREKVRALFEVGVDRVVCLKFDRSLRSLQARDYIQKVLLDAAGVKALIVGDDFRFGCDRSGDFNLLLSVGKELGFEVTDTQTQKEQDDRISSTRIRKLLSEDQLDEAKTLLGRCYSMTGRVFYGKQLGRTLGFPTMNIALGRNQSPLNGVYTISVVLNEDSKSTYKGVANLGIRPTVNGSDKPILEVHLLDENIDAYGKCVEVFFQAKLREEMKFDSIHELKSQVFSDIKAARAFFATN